MTVFLTSSPTGPLDNSRPVEGVDHKNRFPEQLRPFWGPEARCLMIAADPFNAELNDDIRVSLRGAFARGGFPCAVFDVWDHRTADTSAEALRAYDVILLGGGHTPTQNAFFRRIRLRETLRDFPGAVIGISAGSMNCSELVYAQPEMGGEALDPDYCRWLPGLGLLRANILPHYQMIRDWTLDGMRLFEDITYPDSFGHDFLALPDGSYILIREGKKTLWGEAWRIRDGQLTKLCGEGETLPLEE